MTASKKRNAKKLDMILARLERIETLMETFSSGKGSEDDLLTIAETSQLVKLSVSTIYSKVSCNQIPAFKIGKRLYFSREEITAWIRSGRKKTISEIRQEIGKA